MDLRITVPKEIYIDDNLLYSLCKYIKDNYCFEEDALIHHGIHHKYYYTWKSLEQKGDKQAEYILMCLDSAVTSWMNKVLKDIMTSNDNRAKASLYPTILEERRQQRRERIQEVDSYVDEWI